MVLRTTSGSRPAAPGAPTGGLPVAVPPGASGAGRSEGSQGQTAPAIATAAAAPAGASVGVPPAGPSPAVRAAASLFDTTPTGVAGAPLPRTGRTRRSVARATAAALTGALDVIAWSVGRLPSSTEAAPAGGTPEGPSSIGRRPVRPGPVEVAAALLATETGASRSEGSGDRRWTPAAARRPAATRREVARRLARTLPGTPGQTVALSGGPAAGALALLPAVSLPAPAPVPAPPAGRAERFHRVLRQYRPDPVTPPPASFRPLVTAIAGSTPVGLSTGPASTAALAAAGRPAATVGRVIHLSRPLDSSAQSAEILAHELVHAARPSPRPRFFDDDHRSPEEHLARVTGGIVRAMSPPRAAPVARRAGLDLPVGSGVNVLPVAPVQRRPATPAVAPAPTRSTRSARPPAAAGGGQEDFVQRALRLFDSAQQSGPAGPAAGSTGSTGTGVGSTGAGSPGTASAGGGAGGMLQRRVPGRPPSGAPASGLPEAGQSWTPDRPAPAGAQPSEHSPMMGAHRAPVLPAELIEQIVEAVEQRVIDELERRGALYNPGVF